MSLSAIDIPKNENLRNVLLRVFNTLDNEGVRFEEKIENSDILVQEIVNLIINFGKTQDQIIEDKEAIIWPAVLKLSEEIYNIRRPIMEGKYEAKASLRAIIEKDPTKRLRFSEISNFLLVDTKYKTRLRKEARSLEEIQGYVNEVIRGKKED